MEKLWRKRSWRKWTNECILFKQKQKISPMEPFFYMTKKSRQKFEYRQNEKSSEGEIKNIFHHF